MYDAGGAIGSIAPFDEQIILIVETKAELDGFDLQTADRDACMHFRLLRRLYVALCLELIGMIEGNAREFRQGLTNMLRDS